MFRHKADFPGGSDGKASVYDAGDPALIPGLGRSTPVLLPGKSHGQRSLVGCSPWGCKESDTTEQLHVHVQAQSNANFRKFPRTSAP